ncbi:MAG: CHAT domain-containing protein [Thermosynechococcaceae cyanobacterium]
MLLTPGLAQAAGTVAIAQQGQTTETDHASLLQDGRRLYAAGQFAKAATTFQAAAEAYARRGDAANQALSLSYQSLAFQELSQWQVALQSITASLKLLESQPKAEPILLAHALNTQASLLLAMGKGINAIATWKKAQQFYHRAGDTQGALGSQINQAQGLQSLGFYRRSRTLLTDLAEQINHQPDTTLKYQSLHSLGIAYQKLGDFEASETTLQQSLAIAPVLAHSPILLSLGNTLSNLKQPEAALKSFQQAEQTATGSQERLDAQLNQLRLYLDLGRKSQAERLIPSLYDQLATLPASRHSIYSAANFVNSLLAWEPEAAPRSLEDLHLLLVEAASSADQLQDRQAIAHLLLQQGKLYSHFGQIPQAIAFTEGSLATAQGIRATDITAQAAGQLGYLFHRQGNRGDAIASYRQAVQALKTLRSDLATSNPGIQFSFRDSVQPIYRELVELLLTGDAPSQDNLIESRTLIESLQLAELDNFFREACLDLQPLQIDDIDPTAAVIYPIILREQTAILISRPQQPLRYYRIPHPQAQVKTRINAFLESLSPAFDDTARLQRSQQLYDWLIRPAEADQSLANVKTLVFVLDGELRNIPIAALHDGQQYLIEKYRLALSPGLQLLAPRPLTATKLRAISGGISQARQGFSALPGVESEIKQISQNVPTTVLLNQDFTQQNLANSIAKEPANIVHLATHGQFSSEASNTFLLTWNGRLNVKEFSELLSKHDSQMSGAIELLVLSACQTAVGDDRAVLGLAGFAVRSGARTTLATLWPVRDQSTALLMGKFYQFLQTPGTTKAEALQKAQTSLITETDYNDPFFWAPFVLVGNWL